MTLHVHYVTLIIAAHLIYADASVRVGTMLTSPDAAISSHSIEVDKSATTRYLRNHQTEVNDEERGFFGIENLIQTQKLQGWLKSGAKADEALAKLNLHLAGDDIFKSPAWNTWTTYMTMLNKNNADEVMTAALSRQFGSDKLANILASAKTVESTKDIATKLETAQLNRWMRTGGTPESIFKMLNLDKGADNLFDSAAFASWTNYLKLFNDNFPTKKTTVVDTFKSIYDTEGFLKLLISAESTNSAGVKHVKDELVQSWLDFSIPPETVFKALKLDKAADDLLTNPLLSTWVQYMNAFNNQIPRKRTTMIKQFTKTYGDEKVAIMLHVSKKLPKTEKLAENLQAAQFKQWMVENKTPDVIYKTVLKVESPSSQKADIWRAYYNAYDEQFPGLLFSFNPSGRATK